MKTKTVERNRAIFAGFKAGMTPEELAQTFGLAFELGNAGVRKVREVGSVAICVEPVSEEQEDCFAFAARLAGFSLGWFELL